MEQALGRTLKRVRLAAGMTQEELAERAGISGRTVSDVERGLRTLVHHDTARRLTAVLWLGVVQRRGFEVLARGGAHSSRRRFAASQPNKHTTKVLAQRVKP